MNKELLNAKEVADELGLYLKVVVSTKSFENYNAFYNIYGDNEEYCRRIAVITPYEELEEVSDEDPNEKVEEKIFEGNIWLKEYTLTTNPKNINLDELTVSRKIIEEYKKG